MRRDHAPCAWSSPSARLGGAAALLSIVCGVAGVAASVHGRLENPVGTARVGGEATVPGGPQDDGTLAHRAAALRDHREELITILRDFDAEMLAWLRESKQRSARLAEGPGAYASSGDGWQGRRRFFATFAQGYPQFETYLASLRSSPAASLPAWPGTEVDRIVAFDSQLKQRGIDLILMIHPSKEEVYPHRWLGGLADGRYIFPELIPLAISLLDADVEVLFLLPRMLQRAELDPSDYLFDPGTDMHWTHAGTSIAAQAIRQRLERYRFIERRREQAGHGFTRNASGVVFMDEALYRPIDDSPVLVLGDSFAGTEVGYSGLAAEIAYEIGIPTSVLWISSGGLEAPRNLAGMGSGYIDRRAVIIWNVGSILFRPLGETNIRAAPLPGQAAPPAEDPAGALQLYVVVEEVSAVPDPVMSLYDDAVTVTTFRILNVERGGPFAGRRIRAAQWVMNDRQLLPSASLQPGDQLRMWARPFEVVASEAPRVASAQRADDTADITLPLFWVDRSGPIHLPRPHGPLELHQRLPGRAPDVE